MQDNHERHHRLHRVVCMARQSGTAQVLVRRLHWKHTHPYGRSCVMLSVALDRVRGCHTHPHPSCHSTAPVSLAPRSQEHPETISSIAQRRQIRCLAHGPSMRLERQSVISRVVATISSRSPVQSHDSCLPCLSVLSLSSSHRCATLCLYLPTRTICLPVRRSATWRSRTDRHLRSRKATSCALSSSYLKGRSTVRRGLTKRGIDR